MNYDMKKYLVSVIYIIDESLDLSWMTNDLSTRLHIGFQNSMRPTYNLIVSLGQTIERNINE